MAFNLQSMKFRRWLPAAVVVLALAPAVFAGSKKEPEQPDSYNYRRGVEAYDEGDRDLATQYLNKELSDNAKNGYAWLYAASISEGNGELADAVKFYGNALKYIPKAANSMRRQAYSNRASLYVQLKDTLRAIDDLTQALKENKEDIDALAQRGHLYRLMKQYDRAEADFRAILAFDDLSVQGINALGRLYNDQKRWDDAIVQFDRAATLAAKNSAAYSYRADSYIGKKEWAKAADDLIKATELQDQYTPYQIARELPQEMKPVMLTKLKVTAKKDGANVIWPFLASAIQVGLHNYPEAVALLKDSHKIEANSSFLYGVADCYMNMGLFDRAEMFVRRAYAMDPEERGSFYGNMLRVARGGNDLERSLAFCDSIIENAPDEGDSYFSRAFVEFEAGSDSLRAAALEDLDMGLTLSPDDKHAMLWKGDWLRLAGRDDEARELYRTVVDRANPDDSTSYAYAASSLDMADEALRHVLKDVEKDSLDYGAIYNAACIYSRLGRADDAFRLLDKAVDKGFVSAAHFGRDHDFEPLRDRPEFKALLDRMNTRIEANRQEMMRRFPEDFEADSLSVAEIVVVEDSVVPVMASTGAYEVPFTRKNGVTEVQCRINDLPLYFVFDTGASDVTISQTEASFMMKNNYLSPKDVIGSQAYMDANGNVSVGTLVNLRQVNFGGLVLDNVRATVVANQRAPLLLGQSVLGRLGTVKIDNSSRMILITPIR